MKPDRILRGHRVVAPDGVAPAAIHITNGVIAAVRPYDDVPAGTPVEDAGDLVVMPGLVDTHVHINEPGRTEWEGFDTATRAAAAGGVTTLIEMPLNSIPATTTVAAFHAKLAAAQGKCWVDVGFWGGVVPGNAAELRGLFDAGVFGFKCFLVPSGVDEFPCVTEDDLRIALPELVKLGAVLLVHAELPGPIDAAAAAHRNAVPSCYASWLAVRPAKAEEKAVALMIHLCEKFSVRVHIVHLSAANALPLLHWARQQSLPISVETCPHYLTFSAERIADGATQFKCAPPLRERVNREQLWNGLADGIIDLIATDHSPCPPEMKLPETGDFLRAWGGIASLQLSLPAVWTEARKHNHTVADLARWMAAGPARLAGLDNPLRKGYRKGAIAPGCDADLVVWNPDATFRVEPDKLHHRHKLTPYAGRKLEGEVHSTYLRGRRIFHGGEFPAGPQGRILKRNPS